MDDKDSTFEDIIDSYLAYLQVSTFNYQHFPLEVQRSDCLLNEFVLELSGIQAYSL